VGPQGAALSTSVLLAMGSVCLEKVVADVRRL